MSNCICRELHTLANNEYALFCNKMLVLPILLLLLLFLTPLWVYIGCKVDCEKSKHTAPSKAANIMLKNVIKEEREKQDLSLSELARRCGHAVSTLHAIESGDNSNPSYRTIADICAALGLPLDELEQRIKRNE